MLAVQTVWHQCSASKGSLIISTIRMYKTGLVPEYHLAPIRANCLTPFRKILLNVYLARVIAWSGLHKPDIPRQLGSDATWQGTSCRAATHLIYNCTAAYPLSGFKVMV